MKKITLIVALWAALAGSASAQQDQDILDRCIAAWGKDSPFKKGSPADHVIGGGTRVFSLGSTQPLDDLPTDKPLLILVRPAVNVAGTSTIRFSNPNGWYCFSSNVTVAGALRIEAHCHAHIASGQEEATAFGAVDDSSKGTAVFGALRLSRFGCQQSKP